MKMKGQVAIEFMFIILIVIVYITTVTMPLVKESKDAVTDVDSIARANNETQKIVNAINDIYLMGEGSRQTVTVYVPENTTIFCEDKNFSFQTKMALKPYPIECSSGTCIKTFNMPKNVQIECNLQSLSGPAKYITTIEKGTSKITFAQGV